VLTLVYSRVDADGDLREVRIAVASAVIETSNVLRVLMRVSGLAVGPSGPDRPGFMNGF
jgi:hypothetical protein